MSSDRCEEIRKQLPLVLVEFKEWPEAARIRELQSGTLDIGIGHLEGCSDRLESMLLLRERFVLVLPKNHPAARKRAVNFKDLRDDLIVGSSRPFVLIYFSFRFEYLLTVFLLFTSHRGEIIGRSC
jgi:DNA-binding transcriptional LysR family regulator